MARHAARDAVPYRVLQPADIAELLARDIARLRRLTDEMVKPEPVLPVPDLLACVDLIQADINDLRVHSDLLVHVRRN